MLIRLHHVYCTMQHIAIVVLTNIDRFVQAYGGHDVRLKQPAHAHTRHTTHCVITSEGTQPNSLRCNTTHHCDSLVAKHHRQRPADNIHQLRNFEARAQHISVRAASSSDRMMDDGLTCVGTRYSAREDL